MSLEETIQTVECAWPERLHHDNRKLVEMLGKVFHDAQTPESDIVEICELIGDRHLSHFISGQWSGRG